MNYTIVYHCLYSRNAADDPIVEPCDAITQFPLSTANILQLEFAIHLSPHDTRVESGMGGCRSGYQKKLAGSSNLLKVCCRLNAKSSETTKVMTKVTQNDTGMYTKEDNVIYSTG